MPTDDQLSSVQRAFEKYSKHLELPETTIYETLALDTTLFNRAISPYIQALGDLQSVTQRLWATMTPSIDMAAALARYELLLPTVTDSYAAMTTIVEAYRSVQLSMPSYLSIVDFNFQGVVEAATGGVCQRSCRVNLSTGS
jgi:hypothetical protein